MLKIGAKYKHTSGQRYVVLAEHGDWAWGQMSNGQMISVGVSELEEIKCFEFVCKVVIEAETEELAKLQV